MPGTHDVDERRTEACRLEPRLRLRELEDAVEFLEQRGMLTLTPCCALPSLFGACHEEPHSPGKGGYGQYPKTRWWWGGALADTPGCTATKLHRGKTLFLSDRLVPAVDHLCRGELERALAGEFGVDAARMVAHLASAGPSSTDDLKTELGLDARGYQRERRALEQRGAIRTRHVTVDTAQGGHRHMSELSLWRPIADAPPVPMDDAEALGAILTVVVDAAVAIPEPEARRALTWTIPKAVVDDALGDGRIQRLEDGRLALPPG